MEYNKVKIGKGLKEQLKKGYNITRISDWAHDIHVRLSDDEYEALDEILGYIYIMDAGPEFVYTEKELNAIADKLIKNEDIRFPFKMNESENNENTIISKIHKSYLDKFRIVIASMPHRDNCVCEIYYEDEQWVEIYQEEGDSEAMIQFYTPEEMSHLEFPLEVALEVLQNARDEFLEK